MADQPPVELAPEVRALAGGPNYAVLSTLLPDGQPHTQPVWIDTDGTHLLVNTQTHFQKYRNTRRDPRVTVLIVDAVNPYRYVEVRGRVVAEVVGAAARAHKDELAFKYHGGPFGGPTQSERVILKIAPERQIVFRIDPPVGDAGR